MINFIGFSVAFALSALAIILLIAIWIWSIIDCLNTDKKTIEKLMWLVVIVVFNILGSIIYFIFKDSIGSLERKNKKKQHVKELRRSKDNKILAGVFGGIGEYFSIDPTIIRLIWVVITIFSVGTGLILYLAAILIIPEKKDRNKLPKNKIEKEHTTSKNIPVLIISISVVLICIVLSLTLISIIALSQYSEGVSTHGVAIRRIDGPMQAQMISKDIIYTHDIYAKYAGYDLVCEHTEQIYENPLCQDYEDVYNFRISNENCFEVRCTFKSQDQTINGFIVETLIKDNRVKNISFEEISSASIIANEQDCITKGFEVIYPELVGGPLQCYTGNETINITS